MISPEALAALVARMRDHGVTELEQHSQESSFRVVLTEIRLFDSAPGEKPAASSITIRSPEMGICRLEGVAEGNDVQQGGILAFVHIDPLRLPVVAPQAGKVTSISIQDGQTVGYHTPLMTIQPN